MPHFVQELCLKKYKKGEKRLFRTFYSIITNSPIMKRLEIQHEHITHQPQFIHVKFHINAPFFCRSHFQKSIKNGIFTTSCSIKTDLLITQTLEMWYVYDSPTIVCPCKISRQCRTSCRSDIRKSTENGIFKAFCSMKTDLPITYRLEI